MIKAVIFDFDGLILDTESVWYDSYKQVLQEQFQFDLTLEEFAKCVGSTDAVLFSYLGMLGKVWLGISRQHASKVWQLP
jgi:putative hydrolase of the HAD superfamily